MQFLKEKIEHKNLGRLIDQDEQAKRNILIEAWKGTGYLNKLKGRDVGNMAVLMENQKKQILKENNTTADMAIFDTIAIPMIRRQNSLMVTPNLISVQPLSYPHGLVFYLDYKVSNTKKPIGSSYLQNSQTGGQADNMEGNTFSNRSGYDQFYDNANFDLSKGKVIARGWNPNGTPGFNNSSIGGTNDTAVSAAFSARAALSSTGANSTYPSQIAIVDFDLTAIGGITMDQAASLKVYAYTTSNGLSGTQYYQGTDFFVQRVSQNFGVDIMSTGRGSTNISFSGTKTDASNVITAVDATIVQQLQVGTVITGTGIAAGTTIVALSGTTIVLSAAATTSATVTLTTTISVTTSDEGRAGGPGTNNNILRLRIIPAKDGLGSGSSLYLKLAFSQYLSLELFPAFSSELKVEIVQVPIETKIHKMKSSWTVELAQDLMSYYAIDAEAELAQLLAEQLAGEKDRLIVRELATLAAHFEIWNADFYNSIDPNPSNTVFRGIESDYNQGLVLAIQRIDGKIRKSTKQGGANWILISAEGASKLANLNTFKPFDIDDAGTKFALGVEKIGSLESKYNVYIDPNLPAHICLVGRKGTTFFDTGYVYAPYIEYMLSPTVIEDQDFNPRKMISSRFGTKMLNNRFYGVVYMKGIGNFDTFQPDTANNA